MTMPVQLTQVPSRPSGCVRAVRRGRRLDVSYFSFPGPAAAAECADLRPHCIEWPARWGMAPRLTCTQRQRPGRAERPR